MKWRNQNVSVLTDEGRGDAELPLHAAAEVLGDLVPLVRQPQVGDHRGYLGLDHRSVLPLKWVLNKIESNWK